MTEDMDQVRATIRAALNAPVDPEVLAAADQEREDAIAEAFRRGTSTARILDAGEELAKLDPAVVAGAHALPHAHWCDQDDRPPADVLEDTLDLCWPDRWEAAQIVVAAARPLILNGNH